MKIRIRNFLCLALASSAILVAPAGNAVEVRKPVIVTVPRTVVSVPKTVNVPRPNVAPSSGGPRVHVDAQKSVVSVPKTDAGTRSSSAVTHATVANTSTGDRASKTRFDGKKVEGPSLSSVNEASPRSQASKHPDSTATVAKSTSKVETSPSSSSSTTAPGHRSAARAEDSQSPDSHVNALPEPQGGCTVYNSPCVSGQAYVLPKGDAYCADGCVMVWNGSSQTFSPIPAAQPNVTPTGTSGGTAPAGGSGSAGTGSGGYWNNTPCDYCPGGRYMPNVPPAPPIGQAPPGAPPPPAGPVAAAPPPSVPPPPSPPTPPSPSPPAKTPDTPPPNDPGFRTDFANLRDYTNYAQGLPDDLRKQFLNNTTDTLTSLLAIDRGVPDSVLHKSDDNIFDAVSKRYQKIDQSGGFEK